MFVDSARITLVAGKGGNGCVSFRREKYVPAGGPDGGDGGRGGDVVFLGDGGMRTLGDFRYRTKYAAPNGADGASQNRAGRSGEALVIRVPLGTVVMDEATGRVVADVTRDGQRAVAARGGRGGAGNQHFATPTRQAPAFAKAGEEGESLAARVELKLIADVGLVGFPNVGKSTLLSVSSSARPKIADYHFTTLTPNLGVVDIGGEGAGFVMADIPGLIEGAHEGQGLGDAFLRHVERTRLLVHVVDAAGTEGRDPLADFDAINRELRSYKVDLTGKPQIVAANKMDALPGEGPAREAYDAFRAGLARRGVDAHEVSAATGAGVKGLLRAAWEALARMDEEEREAREARAARGAQEGFAAEGFAADGAGDKGPGRGGGARRAARDADGPQGVTVTRGADGAYALGGKWIERLVANVNFSDRESLQYFQRSLRRHGVVDKLEQAGVKEGDTVVACGMEFDYVP